MMKQMTMALILWGAFSWSHAMAQTQELGHKHEQHQEGKEAGYEMLCKGGAERTEKLNAVNFSTQPFLEMTPIDLNHFPIEFPSSLAFMFSLFFHVLCF